MAIARHSTSMLSLTAAFFNLHAQDKQALVRGAPARPGVDPATRGTQPLPDKTGPTCPNLVAVRTADKGKPWVRDLTEARRLREFLAVTEKHFAGFVKTDCRQALAPHGTAAAR